MITNKLDKSRNSKEVWKPIKHFEGIYEVSSYGRVKSLSRMITYGQYKKQSKEILLKPQKDKNGYVTYSLSKNGFTRSYLAHRLVADAFITQPNEGTEINHIDCNKENNHIENLEWVTRAENIRHAFANGLMVRHKGSKNGSALLTEEQVIKIKKDISEGKLYLREIAKKFGVSLTCISHINNGNTWSHVPFPEVKSVKGKRFLREEIVAEIKGLLLYENASVKDVAKKYGISKYAIYKIKTGATWKDIKPKKAVNL